MPNKQSTLTASSWSGDQSDRFGCSVSDVAEGIQETSHLIRGLRSPFESKALHLKLQELTEDLGRATSADTLRDVKARLGALRGALRGVYRRSASRNLCSWQSPLMDHSLDPSVKGCGDVLLQHGIDYHRAAHSAGQQYEHNFAENLLEGHADCRVLATSSGMSAISTALHYVANQISSSEGAVIVDEGCYHETKFLVETLFRNRLRYLDLTSSEVVVTLSALQPALVVFDSTRNSRAISPLPVKEILRAVRHGETYLLIDSTSIVSAGSLLSAAKAEGLIDRVFVAHSLAKMHQYGMDLVTGGMLVYSNGLEQNFPTPTTFRTHLGMNITEDSASVLPAPSLQLLEQRAAMLSRNVGLLASALQGACEELTVCTALCWDSTTQLVPYFNLTLTRGQEASWYRAFIARAMQVCRAQGVALVAGTSFGFDLTRIYLVESLIPTHRPFIRLSPGIETQYEMGLLADALVEAVGEV